MQENRKLSTIVFADIAGYTATMQEDEQKALKQLNLFKSVLEEETKKYGGTIVQFFGDGCLLSFDSPTNALYCSIELQKHFMDQVPVRIGIHIGDVIFKEGNVFGDGVNIASRIESLGIPGAVLVSKVIRDQVKNKLDILLVSLGTFNFKNVTEPMEVFAVANQGFVVPKREQMKGKLQSGKTQVNYKKLALAALFLIVGVFAAWKFLSYNSVADTSKYYLLTISGTEEGVKVEYEVVAKFNFTQEKVSGQYVNSEMARGILNGTYDDRSLELSFITQGMEGQCDLLGTFNKDKTEFKAQFSCIHNEYASLEAVEITTSQFEWVEPQDSIYLVK